jgi:hypothetical protein
MQLLKKCCSQCFRRLREPEANDIPDDFVNLWNEAVKTNAEAIHGFMGMTSLFLHAYIFN